ncbi:hypothetical protein GCM10027159_07660 [Lysobacter terrae]
MANQTDTLRSLMPAAYQHVDDAMRHELEGPGPFDGKIPGFLWETIGNKAVSAVEAKLDLNVFGLFATAWSKAAEIRRLAEESVQKPNVPITVCLGKHEATTTLHPAVDVTLTPLGTKRVPFELDLTAEFETAELDLLNGAIVSIGAARCRVTAQLKCGGKGLHPAKKSDYVKLGAPYLLKSAVRVVEAKA